MAARPGNSNRARTGLSRLRTRLFRVLTHVECANVGWRARGARRRGRHRGLGGGVGHSATLAGMSSIALVTIVSSFLASAVEFVEAVTIVLAVGVTRQWRSTLIGVVAALVVLTLLVAFFGTAIVLF